MRARRLVFALLVSMCLALVYGADVSTAQALPTKAPAAPAPARGSAAQASAPSRGAASGRNVYGTLAQVMRAIPFPNSNIIFDVQDNDPATKKPDPNGPYLGQYQGWEGVENAGIALAEIATLVLLPGRVCSNGKPVPLGQADFVQYARALRTTGMEIYNAAKTRKVDAVNDLSDKLTETCANCHDKYRPDSRIGGPKVGPEKRCTPGA
jgi:hypothetical protein